MKRSAILGASRRSARRGQTRLWPGAALLALPCVFALDCALTGCGNSSDDSNTPSSGGDSTTSPSGTSSAGSSGNGAGDTTTVTEPNRPSASGSPGEGTPSTTLQNPGTGAASGAAGRNRGTEDAGPASTVPVDPAASGLVPCGPAGRFCEEPNLTCCTPGGGAGQGANAATCQASPAACPTGTVTVTSCSSAASCAGGQVCCRAPNA